MWRGGDRRSPATAVSSCRVDGSRKAVRLTPLRLLLPQDT